MEDVSNLFRIGASSLGFIEKHWNAAFLLRELFGIAIKIFWIAVHFIYRLLFTVVKVVVYSVSHVGIHTRNLVSK